MSKPAIPPDVEAVRDRLAEEYINKELDITGKGPIPEDELRGWAISDFQHGFDACYSHILQSGQAEFNNSYQAWVSNNGSRSPSIRIAMYWMHSQNQALISQLQNQIGHLRKDKNRYLDATATLAAQADLLDEKLKIAETALEDIAEFHSKDSWDRVLEIAREALEKLRGEPNEE